MPIPATSVDCPITELERRTLVEYIKAALDEVDVYTDISQGVVDGLQDSLAILGETNESDD